MTILKAIYEYGIDLRNYLF